MKPLDQAIRDAFFAESRRRGVAAKEVLDCVKWLRYYLDFCEKYRHEALDRESPQAFPLKLASKNQSAAQQAQAARSVRLCLDLAAPPPAATVPAPALAPAPTPTPAALRGAPATRRVKATGEAMKGPSLMHRYFL